ncbi:helix-turn-helix domain-containing protein [Bradyrhizobium sp. WSM 1704]|uniref:helix-turn-helix domain-containing protein n=1 Tax=Bradyrhizobium semiaridum TaxID=2821404 RepID=UPI001CE2D7CA|nr:helix-turn-helix domain-containing protein [Bradyrhizobium semiaridum]MCA6122224.1 helix-turn-helix domain-containing protein [Bradyrhizobium semiaridum]
MAHIKIASVDHPGTFITEELEARGWSQVDLAYILGMSVQQLNPLLTGKANITPDLAAALGDAFDMPAEFFANLQKLYELNRVKPVDPGVRTRASWVSHFPVREMIKRGWIEDTEPSLLDLQMLRFFGKNRVEDIPFVGAGQIVAHAAKKSSGYENTTAIQYAWLHRVMTIAKMQEAPLYSEDALRKALVRIKAHLQDKDDLKHIPSILLSCGVRFALVEALPKSKIDGVCVWVDGQPAIGMTTRLDRFDNFAFVLRHELEHVLQGDGREESFAPVDEIDATHFDDSADKPDEERRADEAAVEFCIPKAQLNSFLARKGAFISEQDVIAFAARLAIHPAIVVGQIQHKRQNYAWLRKYQDSIRSHLMDWEFVDGWGRLVPTGL